jgi:hypothetical protein
MQSTCCRAKVVGRAVRHRALLALLVAPVLISGCGGSGGSHRSGRPGSSGQVGSGASCAARTAGQQLAAARVVFEGRMLPGQTVGVGSERFLASPARVLVTRYLKGSGPQVVEVQTAVRPKASGLDVNEDGIQPRSGQRWRIYSSGVHSPLPTSICAGSRALGPLPASFRAAGISFTYPGAWHLARYHVGNSFVSLIAYLSPQPMRRACSVHRARHHRSIRCRTPVTRLRHGSVLIGWARWRSPGWTLRHNPGRFVRIAGRRAKLKVARNSCRIGATREIGAAIPVPGSRGSRYVMLACLRGPGIGELSAQVQAMLRSVRLTHASRPARLTHSRRTGRSKHTAHSRTSRHHHKSRARHRRRRH